LLITESVPKSLDDVVIDFLLSQKRETAEIDFKLIIDIKKNSEFAQSVGKVLSEIPESIKELKDHYRFYM